MLKPLKDYVEMGRDEFSENLCELPKGDLLELAKRMREQLRVINQLNLDKRKELDKCKTEISNLVREVISVANMFDCVDYNRE